jgi:hypothetical protein
MPLPALWAGENASHSFSDNSEVSDMLRYSWSCGLISVLLCVGCGPRNNPKFEKTVPVRGTVVLANGSPVGGGLITFHPKQLNRGDAWGTIRKDGHFELGTYKKDDGAMLGAYTVTIEPIVYDRDGNPRPNHSLGIPAKYTKTESSDLIVEVNDEGAQDMKIVLR